MRSIVFLICFLFASSLFAQCPGGTCQRPAKSVLKATTKVVEKVSVQQPVRKAVKFRLFRRWR